MSARAATGQAPRIAPLTAVDRTQDLFTAPEARGRGVGRALIEAVAAEARQRGAARYYWTTQDHNAVARRLYDRIARHAGFIRYDYPIEPA